VKQDREPYTWDSTHTTHTHTHTHTHTKGQQPQISEKEKLRQREKKKGDKFSPESGNEGGRWASKSEEGPEPVSSVVCPWSGQKAPEPTRGRGGGGRSCLKLKFTF
jgi:hypothetical protein